MKTPHLDRMKHARETLRTQEISDFLDWLGEQGIVLSRPHEHGDSCYDTTDEDREYPTCGLEQEQLLFYHHETKEKLLARYAGVDLAGCEEERVALLEEMRKRHRQRRKEREVVYGLTRPWDRRL